MKTHILVTGMVLAGSAALANDYNFKVTNMLSQGQLVAPLVIVDAAAAEATLFSGSEMSDDFKLVAVDGDPRPMNGKMEEAVAGLVFGTAGPPGVLFDGGETGEADIYIPSTTIRFYAKDESCSDCIISGVWDIAMGGGELLLNSYTTGQEDGSGEIRLRSQGVLKVVMTKN